MAISSPRREIKMTDFTLKVIENIQKIPFGKVASYGQIAALSGKPHGARGVGWILNSCAKKYKLPWQRVVGSQGKISFPRESSEFQKQKNLLRKEGVEVALSGAILLDIYGWKKKPKARRSLLGL